MFRNSSYLRNKGVGLMSHVELKTVARAAEMLAAFQIKSVWTLTEIAAHLSISKSMAHRLLHTLAQYNLVEIDKKTREFRVGTLIHDISHADSAGPRISNIASHLIDEAAAEIEETIAFCQINGMEGVCIKSLGSKHLIRMSISDGDRFALNAGAIGKALLAFQPSDVIEAYLGKASFHAYTVNTPTDPETLRQQLGAIRKLGAARSVAEITEGASSIGIPIFDPDGGVTYCIAASGPTERFSEAQQDRVEKILRRIALKLSVYMARKGISEAADQTTKTGMEIENVI